MVAMARRRGRPKLYEDRQYVKLTKEQRADLEVLVQLHPGTCLADHIREAVDRRRAEARALIEAARHEDEMGEGVMSA
jgi:hypothetical protein